MEEEPFFHQQIAKLLNEEEHSVVELICSPTETREIGDLKGVAYQKRPDYPYDLVFIDGPKIPKTTGYFDRDFLDVVAGSDKPVLALLDGRVETKRCLKILLPGAPK